MLTCYVVPIFLPVLVRICFQAQDTRLLLHPEILIFQIQHPQTVPVYSIRFLPDFRHYDNAAQIAVILAHKYRHIQVLRRFHHLPDKTVLSLPHQLTCPCGQQSFQGAEYFQPGTCPCTYRLIQISDNGSAVNHPVVFPVIIYGLYQLHVNPVHVFSSWLIPRSKMPCPKTTFSS